MGFIIEKMLRPDIKYMMDNNVKIEISDNVDRKELVGCLKLYDLFIFNNDNVLDDHELKYLRQEIGDKITKEKLTMVKQKFFGGFKLRKDNEITPLMKKAILAVDTCLPQKTLYYYASQGADLGITKKILPDYIKTCKDKSKITKVKKYYSALTAHLKRIIKRSDYNALIILKLLSKKDFHFAFNTDPEVNEAISPESGFAAWYSGKNKNIFIGYEILANNTCEYPLEEIFIHEGIHALDDFAGKDNINKTTTKYLSNTVLKREILPLIKEEINRHLKVSKRLIELQTSKKDFKEVTEELKNAICGSNVSYTNKRAEYKIIKENIWNYIEKIRDDHHSVIVRLPFFYYIGTHIDEIDNSNYDNVILEYMAFATQYFLSADIIERERLKFHDRELYNFIEKRFLPLLLK